MGFIFQTMKRESVKIWAGWLESIDNIPDRKSGAELALAIFEYALDGRDYTGSDPWVKVLLPTIKKTIDHSLQNAENGGKGGRRKAENLKAANSTATSTANSDATSTANDTKDVDVDVDNRHKTKDNNIDIDDKEKAEPSSSSKFIFKKALIDNGCNTQLAEDYIALRNRKKAPSTKTAFDGIVREANKYIESHPGATFSDVVTIMVERNWVGFDAAWVKDIPTAEPEESEYMKAMNAQVRRQREIDAEIEEERQRRMRENK
ncbi:MAG: hypothetical protein II425_01730 [Oscillospiraceae bacterium]|nr:hypothetical protein [Oscillospiraceae bacterium]